MSWTENIHCGRCQGTEWHVVAGSWTCACGMVMVLGMIKPYHAELDRIARARKAAEEAASASVAAHAPVAQ